MEEEIRNVAAVLVLHENSPTLAPRVLSSLDLRENGRRWLRFYLVRDVDLDSVVVEHVPAQGHWSIDVLRSPVVQFNCCYFDEEILRRGRVYYVDGFYGPDRAWVEKSEGFRAWARAVFKAVRKHLRKEGSKYVGEDTLTWLANSGGRLVD